MMKTILKLSLLIIVLCQACTNNSNTISQAEDTTKVKMENQKTMNSYIAVFEIPALDIPRAIQFYQNIFDLNLEELEFPGMHMGLFPTDNQMNVGLVLKAQDYVPSANGVTIYFNAGKDLQEKLNKVEANGGEIIVPKTPHADGIGFFALIKDTEGNRIGLNSPE